MVKFYLKPAFGISESGFFLYLTKAPVLKNSVIFILILIYAIAPAIGQDTTESKSRVALKYEDYFKLDRQKIHLHLNKLKFAAGEHIWFSTYVFNRKKNTPAKQAQYIYIDLLNSSGVILESKTILYSNGIGNGDFFLKTNLDSGTYYLRGYTQEMNDFIEDESSVFKFEIINFESAQALVSATDLEHINIKIEPEGGSFIDTVFGSAAIQFSDDQGLPISPDSVILKNSGNKNLSVIKIDSLGIGTFSLIPKKNTKYNILAFINNKKYIQKIPEAKSAGYSLAIDNNYSKKKILVTVNSNSKTQSKNLTLYIHKDGNINSIPLGTKAKHEMVVPYKFLFSGINTITIFENDSVPIAERLVFIPPITHRVTPRLLNQKADNDSLTLLIKIAEPNQKSNNLSLSIIPKSKFSEQATTTIQKSFFLTNVSAEISELLNKLPFLEKESARYKLDKFLILSGYGKYSWKHILNRKIENTIRNTSSIDGYVNLFGAKNDSLTILLYSQANGLFEQAPLKKDLTFQFNELELAKDSKFTLTIINRKGKPVYANFFFVENPIVKPYNKLFKSKQDSLAITETGDNLFNTVEILDEAIVTGNRLKRQELLRGGRYYGRKVDSTFNGMTTLGSFMRSKFLTNTYVPQDYPDPRRAGSIQLSKINELSFPGLIFDGVYSSYVMDFAGVLIEDLDEIYYRKINRADPGFFIVFSKASFKNPVLTERDKNSKDFIVKHGYHVPQPFIRPTYYNIHGEEFQKYGIISWHPAVKPNTKGIVSIKIPNDYKGKMELRAQGFNTDNSYIFHEFIIEPFNRESQE